MERTWSNDSLSFETARIRLGTLGFLVISEDFESIALNLGLTSASFTPARSWSKFRFDELCELQLEGFLERNSHFRQM